MNWHRFFGISPFLAAWMIVMMTLGASPALLGERDDGRESGPDTDTQEVEEAVEADEDRRHEGRFGPREGRGRDERRRPDDMMMLERLLTMSPEQLARVRQTLERIEAMSPDEREAVRNRLREFRQIPPEKREEMRAAWRAMTPEERREHVRQMQERRWQSILEETEPQEEPPPE